MQELQLRWGILGPGKIAQAVVPALAARGGRIVAVASRDDARARDFGLAHGAARAYGSYEALLDDPEVEAVYIALPNSLHAEWSIRVARARKHVLCEKPLAMTVEEAHAMIAAAEAARVVLMEAFMYRFHPQSAAVKAIVEAGEIGQVQLIKSTFAFTVRDPGNVRLAAALGGGSLWDVGCYCVNWSRYLAGEEPEVALAAALFERDADTLFAGTLHFPNGVVSQFDTGFRGPVRVGSEIVGSTGRILVPEPWKPDPRRASFTVEGTAGQREVVFEQGGEWYALQAEAFAAAVRGERSPLVSPSDSLGNTRALVALDRAARERRAILIGEAAA